MTWVRRCPLRRLTDPGGQRRAFTAMTDTVMLDIAALEKAADGG